MELGLNINDLPCGSWAVTWSQENYVQEDATRYGLMYILFDEMQLNRVAFGIVLNNGEQEPLYVDSVEYWQHTGVDTKPTVLSSYILGGVIFDTEELARQFADILHKMFFMSLLKNGM
jgi:hypothetical protein